MEGQQNESLVQRQNCCCLTGHRSLPSDPDQLAELRQNLRRLICDLAQQGITTFYTGGALGFDTMAAMMVLELKKPTATAAAAPCAALPGAGEALESHRSAAVRAN